MTQEIWQHIEYYLASGISVIPVREKEEISNGKTFSAKTPIGKWKEYQQHIIQKNVLWDMMDNHLCAAPAIVCGKVSGSLELIDIDEKHNPGGSAVFLTQLKELYPNLFSRLRIHSTPSGGFHLIYRCEELLEDGNQKLAVAEGRKEAWIETRGEGGYAVAPPAMGYGIVNNVHVPVVTRIERECIIALAKCYDTRKKIEKAFTPTIRDREFYDENPFDDFNNSIEAESLLTQFGWEVYSHNSQFVQYTRPEKKNAISATFIRNKRIYHIFTTSTQLEGDRNYLPATILSILQFGGDKKKTYQALVEKGYGKINKKVEQRLAKSSAAKGAVLPANFSEESKAVFVEESKRLKEQYPYGIFWSGDALAGYKISREKVYQIAGALGFCLLNDDQICHVSGHIVKKVTKRTFFDQVKSYIQEADERTQEDICNAYEAFLQTCGKFTIERLPLLNEMLFLKSTKTTSYKFFRNCYLAIDANGFTTNDYSSLKIPGKNGGTRLIWSDQIQNRNFVEIDNPEKCLYAQFIDKAIVNVEHAQRCIGFLSHDYKDESMGYIMVLTEAVPNPKMGGGSGKNIFTSLFSGTTTNRDVPGSQIQLNEKFLQSWNGERIFSISDAPKRFDFSFLKNLSTGTGLIKKLFKNEESISVEDMPKLIVSTNYSFEVVDGGLRRRLIPIEFTNFFTQAGGVDTYFKKMFPMDWTEDDWNGYDNYILGCIYSYLVNPKLTAPELTEGGWIKQFEMAFGELTHTFIVENIESWRHLGRVAIDSFNNSYKTFCIENGIQSKYQLSSIRMNQALSEYCGKHGIEFIGNAQKKENGIVIKCKTFTVTENAPF